MKKALTILLLLLLVSCATADKINTNSHGLKESINHSIVDGFFGGDTTNISKSIYLVK